MKNQKILYTIILVATIITIFSGLVSAESSTDIQDTLKYIIFGAVALFVMGAIIFFNEAIRQTK
jgi:undecaprenyl pyrophosphate phosphatase UppP